MRNLRMMELELMVMKTCSFNRQTLSQETEAGRIPADLLGVLRCDRFNFFFVL